MKQEDADKKKLTELPDYAALKKLAAALWQENNAYHGAAVMVGAGFSRCGATTGDAQGKLPLWNDLSRILAEELRPDGTSHNVNISDPLRLAEEYCAFFGRQALYDLVKKEVNDAAWTPGQLHQSLLELPWSEVLTTNWDTLLERASRDVHRPLYSVVSKQQDLSSVRSPRIVKLHGTINVSDDLVFTSEDYRKYPQRYAAFVNFARQVFIENELCLLGFSGDDPNFMQWAGWVRDHLATHSRRIYLVGALNLSASKRKYLESINVAPIDIGSLVEDYDNHDEKHAQATKIILRALLDLKPKPAREWSPTRLTRPTLTWEENEKAHKEPEHAAALLEKQLPPLRRDRESYPNWLVCPGHTRWELQNQIGDPFPTARNLAAMSKDGRAHLLYEIAWRHRVTLQATPAWLVEELLLICDPSHPCVLTKKQQLEIAVLLLKNTRWFDDSESQSIEQKTIAILEQNQKYWPDSANELLFHKGLLARDRFQYEYLEQLADKLDETDPVWKLRKASLLSDIGRFEQSENLIAGAYKQLLGQHRNDQNSIYVLSRLAFAHWLLRGVEILKFDHSLDHYPSSYQDVKCSPWTHVEDLREKLDGALEKQRTKQKIEPLFDPGHYKDNSKNLSFNNTLHPLLLLDGLSNDGGMPLRWKSVSFLVEPATKVAELDDVDAVHRYSIAIRAASSDTSEVLKSSFSRTALACLQPSEVDELVKQCGEAIDYWLAKVPSESSGVRGYAVERLRVFCEVVARLSIRLAPDEAKRLFRFAVSLGKNQHFRHVWLFDPLRSLLSHSLQSVPGSEQFELLLDALSFPLKGEIGLNDHREWPNPVIENPGVRTENTAIDRRIDEIVDSIAPFSAESVQPLLRLLPLLKSGFLTEDERLKISSKIWGDSVGSKLPEMGLLKYVLLLLPAPDASHVKNLVRRYLFEAEGNQLFETSRLIDMANAAKARHVEELPSHKQAEDYFARLVAWRQKKEGALAGSIFAQEESATGELIGRALSLSVVPAMSTDLLTGESFGSLYAFYSEVGSREVIMAFAYFAASNASFAPRVEKMIRQQLHDKSGNSAACAAHAVLCWRELSDDPSVKRLVSSLITQVGVNQSAGLAALIWTANQMYRRGYLSKDEVAILLETVPVVFDASDYSRVVPASREAVGISLVRAACVRLAADAVAKGQDADGELARVLEQAKVDALPEVRFATHAVDD